MLLICTPIPTTNQRQVEQVPGLGQVHGHASRSPGSGRSTATPAGPRPRIYCLFAKLHIHAKGAYFHRKHRIFIQKSAYRKRVLCAPRRFLRVDLWFARRAGVRAATSAPYSGSMGSWGCKDIFQNRWVQSIFQENRAIPFFFSENPGNLWKTSKNRANSWSFQLFLGKPWKSLAFSENSEKRIENLTKFRKMSKMLVDSKTMLTKPKIPGNFFWFSRNKVGIYGTGREWR